MDTMKSFEPVYGHISADIAVFIANLFMCGFTLECLIRGIAEGTYIRMRARFFFFDRNVRRLRPAVSLSNRFIRAHTDTFERLYLCLHR